MPPPPAPPPPLPSVFRPARATPFVTEPMRSMELPQWIESDFVDSQAMLVAFKHYKYTCSGEAEAQLKHLYVIDHRMPKTVVLGGIPVEVKEVRDEQPVRKCRKNPCTRCGQQQGGYQFKWYSERWAKWYDENRRPGSLSAAEIRAGAF